MHVEVSSFVKNTWNCFPWRWEEQHIGQQAVLSSEIIRELREDHAEADKYLFKW